MPTSLFEGRPRFLGGSPGVDPAAEGPAGEGPAAEGPAAEGFAAAGLAFLAGWPSPSVVAALFTGCTQQSHSFRHAWATWP